MKRKCFVFVIILFSFSLRAQKDLLTDSLAVPVEIRTSRSYDKGVVSISRSQFLTFPGAFDDPSRLLLKYPGISTKNDQANAVIYHGLPSHYHQWQLYGARILNPNHLSNAGTFSDGPSRSSGGVNMMSGQVIGTMNFYENPSGKSLNSLAGNSDIRLRNPYQNNINLNVSLIGMEAGIDRVFGKEKNQNLMLNYRYSTVGLLTDFGLDFGGEVIKYQDLTAKYSIKTKKAGTFNVYGIVGISSNDKYTISPGLEFKDFEEINYDRQSILIGVNNSYNISKNEKLDFTINYNNVDEERLSSENFTMAEEVPKITNLDEIMISSKIEYVKTRENYSIGLNLLVSYLDTKFDYVLRSKRGAFVDGDIFIGHSNYLSRVESQLGINYKRVFGNTELKFEPGIIYNTNSKTTYFINSTSLEHKVNIWKFELNYSLSRQEVPPEYHLYFTNNKQTANHIGMHSFAASISYDGLEFKTFYHQMIDGFSTSEGTIFSSLDELGNYPSVITFSSTTFPSFVSLNASIYGIDLSYKTDIFGFEIFPYLSIFNGRQTIADKSVNIPYNFGHIANIRVSKKWKINEKRYLGVGLSFHHRGGAYQSRVNEETSLDYGFTNFETEDPYSLRLSSYHRADMRIYYIVKKGKYKSTVSLDIQNVTNRVNDAFYYYEPVDQSSRLRKQLGLLPVLSWRVSF